MNQGAIEAIGWASSAILLTTIMRQVYTQWKTKSCLGLSKWLFVGQLTASAGYTTYCILLHNWLFASSNVALLGTAVLGQILFLRNKRGEAQRSTSEATARHAGPRIAVAPATSSSTI
jgi:MtN3 and saliva related transmembrane protein